MATFSGQIILNPERVHELLQGPDGPVVRELFVAGELVKVEAKRLVGVSKPNPFAPKASAGGRDSRGRFTAATKVRKPGTLRDSIVKRLTVGIGGMPTMQVGSDDPVALWHHEGTQPHTIRPVKAPRLVFYWAKTGKVMSLLVVHHPGTRPNRFLVDALRVLRGRY